MKEHYHAIALKKYDIGEVDRIYIFYTRERGLIRVKAKGVRRAHARLAAHTEDFVVAHIGIVRGRGRDTLTGAITEISSDAMRSDLDGLVALSALRDQVIHVLHDEQVDPVLFDFLKDLFINANEKVTSDGSTVQFLCVLALFRIYDHLGYHFALHQCAHCGNSLKSGQNFFAPSAGGVLCSSCGRLFPGSFAISIEAIKCLRLGQTQGCADLAKIIVSDAHVRELDRVVKEVYRWVMR